MTEQEQRAFDQMREALEGLLSTPNDDSPESVARAILYNGKARRALTAANAVSHAKPETTPSPESRAITSESAANAVSHPQATEPALSQQLQEQWGSLFTWQDGSTEAIAICDYHADDFARCASARPLYYHPQATEPK